MDRGGFGGSGPLALLEAGEAYRLNVNCLIRQANVRLKSEASWLLREGPSWVDAVVAPVLAANQNNLARLAHSTR